MAITIVDVEDVLRQRPQPLTLCGLQALSAAREPYRAVLLQPTGVIEANDARVGHADVAPWPCTLQWLHLDCSSSPRGLGCCSRILRSVDRCG